MQIQVNQKVLVLLLFRKKQ